MPAKTRSEQLFERALARYGLTAWRYERKHPGAAHRPDYTVQYGSQELIFELKQFLPGARDFMPGRRGSPDPVDEIRERIKAAGGQFQEFRENVCALVLFNAGKPMELSQATVSRAMFGELGWRVPFVAGAVKADPVYVVFSAVLVMEPMAGTDPEAVRFITCENPLATRPLPAGLFAAQGDERHAIIDGYWRRR